MEAPKNTLPRLFIDSSDRQKENHTICSQLAALEEYAGSHGYLVPPEWRFQDEGYSGATLLR